MRLATLVTAALIGSCASAGPQLADRLLQTSGAPGAGVATWNGDSIAISVAGHRKADGASVMEGDLWHIGSNTKAMTAALAARLVEAGALAWDDTVGGVLGDAITIHPSYADVTLEELLSHRSGLPANEPMWRSAKALFFPSSAPLSQQRLRYAAAILRKPMGGVRGTFLYSNAGYVIAGAMIESRSGQSWEEAMRMHVFTPLGLNTAGFGPPQGDQPEGHSLDGNGCTPMGQDIEADNPAYLGPAGTIHLSLADQMTWLIANATARSDFLSRESWDRLHRPIGDYALGWGALANGRLGHSGSNNMWYSVVIFQSDPPFAIVLNTNCGTREGSEQMAGEMLETFPAPVTDTGKAD